MIDTTSYGSVTYYPIVISNPDDCANALMSPRMFKAYLQHRINKHDRLAIKNWKVWKHVTWWETDEKYFNKEHKHK